MTYLVDTENVGYSWIEMLDGLTSDDVVYLFYTDKSPNKIDFTQLMSVVDCDATVCCIQCRMGANALDFQLCSYLGYLVAFNPNGKFCIISKDHGYDVVVDFWRDSGIDIARYVVYSGGSVGMEKSETVKMFELTHNINLTQTLMPPEPLNVKPVPESTLKEWSPLVELYGSGGKVVGDEVKSKVPRVFTDGDYLRIIREAGQSAQIPQPKLQAISAMIRRSVGHSPGMRVQYVKQAISMRWPMECESMWRVLHNVIKEAIRRSEECNHESVVEG